MSINYPSGYDSFPVPSLPEETSLSEAGTATRNHTEHHEDLGKAVEALQQNTALRTHDHSGGTGIGGSQKLTQANTHESADTNASLDAIHHTLGVGPFQAAPGDHIHNYNTLTERPIVVCTSNTRPPNPFFGQRIWETDTNRERVWSAFESNTAVNGLYGGDSFTRTSSSNLGPSLWEQTYLIGPGKGIMATPDGHTASWIDQSNDTNTCFARRIHPADRETLTDDQSVTFKIGGQSIEQSIEFSDNASNDVYLRCSTDGQSWIRVQVGDGIIKVESTTAGFGNETQLGAFTVPTRGPNYEWRINVIGRTVSVHRDDSFVGSVTDFDELSNKGAAYRGWGIGMKAGARLGLFQTTPANIEDVIIQDVTYYSSTHKWALVASGAIPVLRLQQNTRQPISSGSTGSLIEWRQVHEDSFNFFNASSSLTDIIIKESGLYWCNAAIAWDPGNMGDRAMIGLEINGLATIYKDWSWVRGNTFTPGFSQTISVTAPLRMAEGDVLRLRAKHNKDFEIFSYSSTADKQDTHLELVYISP